MQARSPSRPLITRLIFGFAVCVPVVMGSLEAFLSVSRLPSPQLRVLSRPSRWMHAPQRGRSVPRGQGVVCWLSSLSVARAESAGRSAVPGGAVRGKVAARGGRKGRGKSTALRMGFDEVPEWVKVLPAVKELLPGDPWQAPVPQMPLSLATTITPSTAEHSVEIINGVAGSRKTQYAIDTAMTQVTSGAAKNVLFLAKVGTNAQEIRSRLSRQYGLTFLQYKGTNHYLAIVENATAMSALNSTVVMNEGVQVEEAVTGAKPKKKSTGNGQKGIKKTSKPTAVSILSRRPDAPVIWVTTLDAFYDCQLRTHASLSEKLARRGAGANYLWKKEELLSLITYGKHTTIRTKDGSSADMLIVDEAQDMRKDDAQILTGLLSHAMPSVKGLIVGDPEQAVFSDVIAGDGEGVSLDVLHKSLPQHGVKRSRLINNHRCPHPHVAFNNLIMRRNGTDAVLPSSDIAPKHEHRPYVFPYRLHAGGNEQQQPQTHVHSADNGTQESAAAEGMTATRPFELNPVPNHSAYMVAKRITRMIKELFTHLPDLRLSDIAITSRFVNSNRLLLQLEDVLNRELAAAGYHPPEGGRAVHLFRTKVNDRRRINFDEAGGRLVMGSLTAFKGKDWRVVFLLDCSEGVLPSKSAVGTETELTDKSLINVGTTRSTEVLIVGFDASRPSRYLSQVRDDMPSTAQVEWNVSTVDRDGLYRALFDTKKHDYKILWDMGREKNVRVPFKSSWYVTDCTDNIGTTAEVLEGDDDLIQFKADVFGTPLTRPKWLEDDEIGLSIVGVMGELLLLREMLRRGMITKDGDLLWSALQRLSWTDPASPRSCVIFTDRPELLNLCADYELNDLWAKGMDQEYQQSVDRMMDEHPRLFTSLDATHLSPSTAPETLSSSSSSSHFTSAADSGPSLAEPTIPARSPALTSSSPSPPPPSTAPSSPSPPSSPTATLRFFLTSPSRCIMHTSHKYLLRSVSVIVDLTVADEDVSPHVLWNAAVLYQDVLNQRERNPGLIHRLLNADTAAPDGLPELVKGLSHNAKEYCTFKQIRGSSDFTHAGGVGVWVTEKDPEALEGRGFDKKLDKQVYEQGWGYGIRGRMDFYDDKLKRVVEVKVSGGKEWVGGRAGGGGGGVKPAHEVQTLLYALLSRPAARSFEVVNLLRGARTKYAMPRAVRRGPIMKRVWKKLEFDDDMISALDAVYPPSAWEAHEDAMKLKEGEGERGGEGGDGGSAEEEGVVESVGALR